MIATLTICFFFVLGRAGEDLTVEFRIDGPNLQDWINIVNLRRSIAQEMLRVKDTEEPLLCLADVLATVYKEPELPETRGNPEDRMNTIVYRNPGDSDADKMVNELARMKEDMEDTFIKFVNIYKQVDAHWSGMPLISSKLKNVTASLRFFWQPSQSKKIDSHISVIFKAMEDIKSSISYYIPRNYQTSKSIYSPFADSQRARVQEKQSPSVSFYQGFKFPMEDVTRIIKVIEELQRINGLNLRMLQNISVDSQEKDKDNDRRGLDDTEFVENHLTSFARTLELMKQNIEQRDLLNKANVTKSKTYITEIERLAAKDFKRVKLELGENITRVRHIASTLSNRLKNSAYDDKLEVEFEREMSQSIVNTLNSLAEKLNRKNYKSKGMSEVHKKITDQINSIIANVNERAESPSENMPAPTLFKQQAKDIMDDINSMVGRIQDKINVDKKAKQEQATIGNRIVKDLNFIAQKLEEGLNDKTIKWLDLQMWVNKTIYHGINVNDKEPNNIDEAKVTGFKVTYFDKQEGVDKVFHLKDTTCNVGIGYAMDHPIPSNFHNIRFDGSEYHQEHSKRVFNYPFTRNAIDLSDPEIKLVIKTEHPLPKSILNARVNGSNGEFDAYDCNIELLGGKDLRLRISVKQTQTRNVRYLI